MESKLISNIFTAEDEEDDFPLNSRCIDIKLQGHNRANQFIVQLRESSKEHEIKEEPEPTPIDYPKVLAQIYDEEDYD